MTWYHRYKPAASVQTQLATAAVMWTLVGAGLLAAGTAWSRSAGTARLVLLLAAAATLGYFKARLVLRKSANRIIQRIRARGDGRCLGGFISWRTWVMVGIMMLLGRTLRHGLLPRPVVAFIYQAVGVALLVGAASFWTNLKTPRANEPASRLAQAPVLPGEAQGADDLMRRGAAGPCDDVET